MGSGEWGVGSVFKNIVRGDASRACEDMPAIFPT